MNTLSAKLNEEIERLEAQRSDLDRKIEALKVAKSHMASHSSGTAKSTIKRDKQWLAKTEAFLRETNGSINAEAVCKYFGIGRSVAQQRLNRLVGLGKLRRVRRGVFRKPTVKSKKG
jgi:hypothetical protein